MNLTDSIAGLTGTTLATRKLEWDARSAQIQSMFPEIYQMLYKESTMQVNDATIMAAKFVGASKTFVDLFKSDDDISIGLSSRSNGRPPKDELFLLTHVALLYAEAAGNTPDDVKAADFNLIPNEMRNGLIEITQNKRILMPEQEMDQFYIADHFVAVGDSNEPAGTPVKYDMQGVGHVGIVKLSNPKFIVPERSIEVNLKFAAALNPNAAVKIVLYGVKNVRV